MKIILKQDWDIPVQIPSKEQFPKTGHFVGRKAELAIFVNELLRREQGAILVTGYRGVGKTSFVHKALHELFEQYDKKKLLLVLVNGNHLESDGYSRGTSPKSILVNLIRRLYASAQNENLRSGLKQDLESLYKKAVSSEFKLSEAIEHNKKIAQETETSVQAEISAQQLGATQIIWLLSFSLALVTQIFPILPDSVWISKILPLLLAFPVPLLLSFAWKTGQKMSTSEASTNSAQQLYTMDNSVNNLEFDLERLHDELRKDGIKTIYVLDELDKLDVDTIFNAMKYFKNLFTLSSALFVFVGGEELFLKYQVVEERSDHYGDPLPDYRPLEYTYFSSKYFLARPSDVDLLAFLDEVIDNFNEIKSESAFEDYKRSLIFDAKGDFFDLIQVVKGKISTFDGVRPVLVFEADNGTKLKADLQRAVSALFNAKYASFLPANWLENENIIRRLYFEAEGLLTKRPGDDVPGTSDKSSRSLVTNSVLPDYATDDFCRLLHRVGFLEFSTSENGSKKYFRGTKVEGNISNYLSSLSELEEQLVSKIEKIYRIMLNYCNFYFALQRAPLISFAEFRNKPLSIAYRMNLWGRDARNTLLEFEPVYKTLTDLQPMRMDDVKKFTDDADSAISRLSSQPYDFLANIFVDAFKDVSLEVTNLDQRPDLLKPRAKGEYESTPEEKLGIHFHTVRKANYDSTEYDTYLGERQISGVPNQLVLSSDFACPVIFLPNIQYNLQAQPSEQYEHTIVGCVTGISNIEGFMFSPTAEDAQSLKPGVEILLRRLTKTEQSN